MPRDSDAIRMSFEPASRTRDPVVGADIEVMAGNGVDAAEQVNVEESMVC